MTVLRTMNCLVYGAVLASWLKVWKAIVEFTEGDWTDLSKWLPTELKVGNQNLILKNSPRVAGGISVLLRASTSVLVSNLLLLLIKMA